jgi:hypothetical protein
LLVLVSFNYSFSKHTHFTASDGKMIFGYEMGSMRKKSVGSCSQVDPDSSDSIVSDYRLDDREIVVRSPAVVR